MGYAAITNALGEGRYRIKIDSGEWQRVALLDAVNQALAIVGDKITLAYEQVLVADAKEAEGREAINALIAVIVAVGDSAAAGLAAKVLEIEKQKYARIVSAHQPIRQQYASLKQTQADLLRQRSAWETLQTITYKEAWCTDYTTDGSGAYVATIDIPGDSSLTLLAPGCREARNGDGTISTARKALEVSNRTNELTKATLQLTQVDAWLVTQRARETTLKAEVAAAQAAYVASKLDADYAIFEQKTKELASVRHDIANQEVTRQVLSVTISRLEAEIADWSNRPASESPDAGDGALRERALLSPAQTFFNAAIFPAWQKWMPTYRWGTVSNIDRDANTATVTLGAATSVAQNLPVNQTSVLSDVQFEYMQCHNYAFDDGDNCIVKFTGQDWSQPKIIGFLDSPKECKFKIVVVIIDGNIVDLFPNKPVGSTVNSYTALPPSTTTPPSNGVGKFIGWYKNGELYGSDTESAPFKVKPDDPSTITLVATYYYPPNVWVSFSEFVSLSSNYVTTWQYDGKFGVTDIDLWSYSVDGSNNWQSDLRISATGYGDPVIAEEFNIISVTPKTVNWTSSYNHIASNTNYADPPNTPGLQFQQDAYLIPTDEPPTTGSPAPIPSVAGFMPVIQTIYGTVYYELIAQDSNQQMRCRPVAITSD